MARSSYRVFGYVYAAAIVSLTVLCVVSTTLAQPRVKTKAPAKVATASNSAAARPVAVKEPQKCSGKTGLSPAEITELLAAHNRARAESNVSPVTWDCKLADLAQEWATRGKFEHRENFVYGENMFVSSNTAEPITTVVSRWLAEKSNWNNSTGICMAGKICTHYTQTMWKTTTKVGCGINRAGTEKWKTVVVCNYEPASLSSGPAY